ncbi:putative non-specific serine/threonine protein kinase [Helianthus annuus]|nr:putative non-specific serine/threonine protein kinase [Helianthus annuus]
MVYESISFYTETILPGVNPGICGNSTSSGRNVSKTAVDVFLSSLSIANPKINGLYAAATTSVVGNDTSIAYAIAQCAETLTTDECKSCLEVAYASISICASNDVIDGRAIESGCFMRYSTIPFFRSNQITDIAPFLRDDFLHMQILKARRTWSMTSSGMKTRREGAQKMKMIELPLAIINTTRISLHKDKVFSRA